MSIYKISNQHLIMFHDYLIYKYFKKNKYY
uniref:Uncharacterized protein n=1 Tax=viral metagenome TaxID=1070528 RepID=A0A6C0H7A3_9ZZZZ